MIYYPKSFGNYFDEYKGIKMAFILKNEYKKTVTIFNESLVNEYIIKDLKANDILVINNLKDIKKKNILVWDSKYKTKEAYDYLKEKNIIYYNAQNIIKYELANQKNIDGYKLIYLSDNKNDWYQNSDLIINNKDDFEKINKKNKYYIVNDLPNYTLFNSLIRYLNKNKINYEYDSISYNNQKEIITSSVNLSKKVDILFIIGNEKNELDNELFKKSSKNTKTYYFNNLNDYFKYLLKHKINLDKKIGFTGNIFISKYDIYDYSNLLEFINLYQKNKETFDNKEEVSFDIKKLEFLEYLVHISKQSLEYLYNDNTNILLGFIKYLELTKK